MASYADQFDSSSRHGWHLYLLTEDGGEYCKVGTALTVKYRVDGLRNGNPRKLVLVGDWHFPDREDALAVEALVLSLASSHRVPRRDWLKLDVSEAIGFVLRAIAMLGLSPRGGLSK